MRTTIDIADDLLRKAKDIAARTRRPLKAVIEDALRESLARRAERPAGAQRIKLAKARRLGRPRAGVNFDHMADVYDLMDARNGPA